MLSRAELLELERLDGPSLREIAKEKEHGKSTERAEAAKQILIGRWPAEHGKGCSSGMNLDYYERRGGRHFAVSKKRWRMYD